MPGSTQQKADSIGFLVWFGFAIIFVSMIFFMRLFVCFKQSLGFCCLSSFDEGGAYAHG